MKGNGKKHQDSPNLKKRANGVGNQQKEEKRLQPRRLQDNFDTDAALPSDTCSSTNGQQVVCNSNCEHLSSRSFLNFKFDREAIMKCFDS